MALNLKESTFDWFVCDCGNSPRLDGFETCLKDGKIVEPTPEEWDGIHYRCNRCETVYDQDTMEEVAG